MTGRGMGYCGGFDAPGYVRSGGGYGAGYGGGRGRGARGWFGRGLRHRRGAGYGWWGPGWDAYGVAAPPPVGAPPVTPTDEADVLTAQAEYLSEALKDVQRRLDDLEKDE